jgi:hypothetical protein
MNFSRSSMGLHAFQGILRSRKRPQLCNPCLRNEMSPLSQEGQRSVLDLFAGDGGREDVLPADDPDGLVVAGSTALRTSQRCIIRNAEPS